MRISNLFKYLQHRGRALPLWYLCCCIALLACASIRSAPVYGKLDFILVDSKPWWPAWKPMIDELFDADDRPIVTDATTSTVLNSVFNLDTVYFRRIAFPLILHIEQLELDNKPLSASLPFGAYMLLERESSKHPSENGQNEVSFPEWRQALEASAGNGGRPFHCVVNLEGFTPSWVSWETLHWNPFLAYTSSHYRYHSLRNDALIKELQTVKLQNCKVYD